MSKFNVSQTEGVFAYSHIPKMLQKCLSFVCWFVFRFARALKYLKKWFYYIVKSQNTEQKRKNFNNSGKILLNILIAFCLFIFFANILNRYIIPNFRFIEKCVDFIIYLPPECKKINNKQSNRSQRKNNNTRNIIRTKGVTSECCDSNNNSIEHN